MLSDARAESQAGDIKMTDKVKVVNHNYNSTWFTGIGSIIAVILSYSLNHSVPWAILHIVLSWTYVIYAALARSKEIIPALQNMFM